MIYLALVQFAAFQFQVPSLPLPEQANCIAVFGPAQPMPKPSVFAGYRPGESQKAIQELDSGYVVMRSLGQSDVVVSPEVPEIARLRRSILALETFVPPKETGIVRVSDLGHGIVDYCSEVVSGLAQYAAGLKGDTVGAFEVAIRVNLTANGKTVEANFATDSTAGMTPDQRLEYRKRLYGSPIRPTVDHRGFEESIVADQQRSERFGGLAGINIRYFGAFPERVDRIDHFRRGILALGEYRQILRERLTIKLSAVRQQMESVFQRVGIEAQSGTPVESLPSKDRTRLERYFKDNWREAGFDSADEAANFLSGAVLSGQSPSLRIKLPLIPAGTLLQVEVRNR